MPDSTPQPPATTTDPRQFGDHALNVAVAAACFRAVRRNRPLPQSEAATVAVFIDHESVAAWLKAAPITLAGRRDGGR